MALATGFLALYLSVFRRELRFPHALLMVPIGIGVLWLIVRSVGSVLIVPLAEELVFRGYLLSRLSGREPSMVDRLPLSWLAIGISALSFGLLHGAWLAGTAAGLIYVWVRYRRGEVMDAVFAHATTNALVTVYVFGTGEWSGW